jgi:serine/threonine protein kinase
LPETLNPYELLKERYIILKTIGRGGMGAIYLADDNRLAGRQCAIKEVRQESGLPHNLIKQGREQFYREASVLAMLDHPTLPKVSDYFAEGDRDYLVMDFVPGDDLKTLMDRSRRRGKFLNIADVMSWALQITDALDYLHGQESPVIHRDIKPSNLKLTPRGQIKLVDFGLVKQMVPDEMTITVIQGRGTALYTPLEQYGGDAGHTDTRSDIYAFGATLYHLTTNQPPIEAKQRFLQPSSLTPPSDFNSDIDHDLERGILWAMELHPDNRPQSIAELGNVLFSDRSLTSIIQTELPFNIFGIIEDPANTVLAVVAGILLVIAVVASFF